MYRLLKASVGSLVLLAMCVGPSQAQSRSGWGWDRSAGSKLTGEAFEVLVQSRHGYGTWGNAMSYSNNFYHRGPGMQYSAGYPSYDAGYSTFATGPTYPGTPYQAAYPSAYQDCVKQPQPYQAARPITPADSQTMTGYPSLLDVKPGEMVVVSSDNANLMRGAAVLTALPEGHRLTVTEVRGPWLGTNVDVDGQSFSGWILSRDVRSLEDPGSPGKMARENSQRAW